MFPTILFFIFASVLVCAALGVILARNPVHSALLLVLCFFNSAVIWLLLDAEFLGIVLVLVYVGAVMVLFLFVVMMLDINVEEFRKSLAGLLAAGRRGRRLRGVRHYQRDRGETPGRDSSHEGAAAAGTLFQYPCAGHGIVHPLCLPGAARGLHSAGGERRGHCPDAAASHRRQAAGYRQAGGGAGEGSGPYRQNGGREETMITLTHVLALSGILFAIAVAGVFLNRRNIIVLLMCIELMLLAVNFNFVAFSRFLGDISGQVFVFFILTVAAAEAAIGLAILVVLFRERSTIDVEDLDTLQG
jgi:NADH-quinone oxidoreductase subunit K